MVSLSVKVFWYRSAIAVGIGSGEWWDTWWYIAALWHDSWSVRTKAVGTTVQRQIKSTQLLLIRANQSMPSESNHFRDGCDWEQQVARFWSLIRHLDTKASPSLYRTNQLIELCSLHVHQLIHMTFFINVIRSQSNITRTVVTRTSDFVKHLPWTESWSIGHISTTEASTTPFPLSD
jgi:hypothetical protein